MVGLAIEGRHGHGRVRRPQVTPASGDQRRSTSAPPIVSHASPENAEEIEMDEIGAAGRQGRRGDIENGAREFDINESNKNDSGEVITRNLCDWTIIQAWTIFGYATMTLPFFIRYDARKNEYELRSCILQKLLCIMQHVCAVVDVAINLGSIPTLINTNPSPFTFIRIGGVIAQVALSIWFFKVSFMNASYLRNYHIAGIEFQEAIHLDNQLRNQEVNGMQPYLASHSSKKGLLSLAASAIFITIMVSIDATILLNTFDGDWKAGGGPTIVQGFACYGRMAYEWKNFDTCGSERLATAYSLLPAKDIYMSIPGIITFFNAKIALYQKFVAIDVVNFAFYNDARNAKEGIEAGIVPVGRTYDHLSAQTKSLSGFAGPLLMMQLLATGLNVPDWSMAILLKNVPITVYILVLFLGFFSFLLLGCTAVVIADKIKGELTGPRGRHEIPFARRELAAFIVNTLFGKVGLGFDGLLVLNFGTLLAYLSTVGTWIGFLYDVEHGH